MTRAFPLLTILFSFSLYAAGHDLSASPVHALPVVTGNGSAFTAAWCEPVLNRYSLASSVVTANGNLIENGGTAVDLWRTSTPAIAHNPSDALVAWVGWTTGSGAILFAERLSPSGIPISTANVVFAKHDILNTMSDVAVSWNGSRYFVIWSNGPQLLGAFVAPDGSLTTPKPFFNEPATTAREMVIGPDVAWDGRHFVVVFGERPGNGCADIEPCPLMDPDQFRVMRVSADGDALDPSPVVIPRWSQRVHVASSGGEALITMDDAGGVTAIIAHTNGDLTLDPPTPIFQWCSEVASAVVWDGSKYIVGWRYVGNNRGPSWLGVAQVSRTGVPFDYHFAETGRPNPNPTSEEVIRNSDVSLWGRPAIAVNDAGATALVILELDGPSFRARLYFVSELAPMPSPPPAPRNVIGYFDGSMARINWQSDKAATGFAIDAWWAPGNFWWVYGIAPGDARTISFSTFIGSTSIGSLFRVRALGPGGVSEGTITTSNPRTRTVRR